MSTPVDIAPATGKLGVLLVGLGAVSTTTIAGVLAIRKGIAKPIGSLTQMGTIRLGKRTDGAVAEDQGVRAARRSERHRLRRLGHLRRQLLRSGQSMPACSRKRCSIRCKDELAAIKPMAGGVRSALREAARRPERQEGQEQEGSRRSADRRHPQVQERQQLRSPRHGVGRQHRDLHDRGARATSRWPPSRQGARGERSGDCVEHDLRLRGDQRRHAVRATPRRT